MEYGSEVARRFELAARNDDLPADTPGLLAGEAADRTLQVWVRFQLQVIDGIVREARYRVFGCPHTVAAASYVAEWLEGRTVESARRLDVQAVRAALGVPVEKLGKLLRIEDALAACWREWNEEEARGT
jgi:NifU-like protein involved in Fe-S cluster formation